MRYIEAHLDRPVRLAELGRVAGMSPFTVQRLFKREMGVSPLQYQRALRARRAACGAQKRRTCDRCDLHRRIRLVEPRLRRETNSA